MKNKNRTQPTRHKFSILRQVCNLIPPFLVSKLARETGVEKKARTYSVWSHVVTMLYAQLTHCISLNDVCDGLRLHQGELQTIRGATPPSRNNLSHANRKREASFIERLFWQVLGHLQQTTPEFTRGRGRGRPLRRFKRAIHAVDSSTIKLIMSCFSWAEHRRRKAAVKLHLRLDLQSFLPGYAIVDRAKGHDNQKARELCLGLKAGEIVIFDMAYVAFAHLWELKWQVWTALLVYVLLRYMAFVSRWAQSFIRVWALVRAGLWKRVYLLDLLRHSCGTAGKPWRFRAAPEQAYLPGFA